MFSPSSMETQFSEYQSQLKELKAILIEEQRCQTALQSADNELKLQMSPERFTESEMATPDDQQAILARIDAAEKKLDAVQKKLATTKKAIAQHEKTLTDVLTDRLFSNIIAIQTEQKVAGWSNQSGKVLIETLGQIQEAKSTAQLQLLSESFMNLLKVVSINNDRLKIDSIITTAEMAMDTLSKKKPLTEKERGKIIKRMENTRKAFDERAEAMIVKLVEEMDKQQKILKTLEDPDAIREKKQIIESLQEGITKIENLTEKVHAVTDAPLFTEKTLSPEEVEKQVKVVNESLIELSAAATGRSMDEVRKEGLGTPGKQTLDACIENCVKLTFIKYAQLIVTENLKNEAGKELLINAVLNSVLTGLSVYTLGNPGADLAKDVQSAISGGKKARDYSQLDKSLMDTLSQYIKDNPMKIKVGGPAIVAVATVLFIVFPPTTAMAICGTLLSAKSTASDLKELVSYLVDEVKNTREISQSLDKHGELINTLLAEAKLAQLDTDLTALQEVGLLLGKMVGEARAAPKAAPIAPKAEAPKAEAPKAEAPKRSTISIFSGLKSKITKPPTPTAPVTTPTPPKTTMKAKGPAPTPANDETFTQEATSVRKMSR